MVFSWWVLARLAPVYSYTVEGRLTSASTGHLPSNWVFVQELLPLTFQQSEPELRRIMSSLLVLSRLWPPSVQPLTRAWEFFHKHMVLTYSQLLPLCASVEELSVSLCATE